MTWKQAWDQVTELEIEALRAVLEVAVIAKGRRSRICTDAEIYEHDLRNFLSHNSAKPKYRPGLRMLRYAAELEAIRGNSQFNKNLAVVTKAAKRISRLDVDEDHLFTYLNKLGIGTVGRLPAHGSSLAELVGLPNRIPLKC